MKHKTKQLTDSLLKIISSWDAVRCVALNEAALPDTLDPYFALILDVYYTGSIPKPEDRRKAYGADTFSFETSSLNNKDRFLAGELPVRIEYKECERISDIVNIADKQPDQLWRIKDSGTYMFYRIMNGQILFQRDDWIDTIRDRLENPGDEFWLNMRSANETRMEHYLGDLGAALVQEDNFHYLISAAGFIKHACAALFCVNKSYEPSHRGYSIQIRDLEIIPDEFEARFDSFLSSDSEITRDRKYTLAQLIAKSILAL